jgi:lactoylglutathione lyase
MLSFGATYLIVKNMEISENFYTKLFEKDPDEIIETRWKQYKLDGGCLALYNREYDNELLEKSKNAGKSFDEKYIEYFRKEEIRYGNNVILNLSVDDLKIEYERLNKLNIGNISEIQYVKIAFPYYFFMIEDPDGNKIEITGGMNKNI